MPKTVNPANPCYGLRLCGISSGFRQWTATAKRVAGYHQCLSGDLRPAFHRRFRWITEEAVTLPEIIVPDAIGLTCDADSKSTMAWCLENYEKALNWRRDLNPLQSQQDIQARADYACLECMGALHAPIPSASRALCEPNNGDLGMDGITFVCNPRKPGLSCTSAGRILINLKNLRHRESWRAIPDRIVRFRNDDGDPHIRALTVAEETVWFGQSRVPPWITIFQAVLYRVQHSAQFHSIKIFVGARDLGKPSNLLRVGSGSAIFEEMADYFRRLREDTVYIFEIEIYWYLQCHFSLMWWLWLRLGVSRLPGSISPEIKRDFSPNLADNIVPSYSILAWQSNAWTRHC
jgi:hypothetical protein